MSKRAELRRQEKELEKKDKKLNESTGANRKRRRATIKYMGRRRNNGSFYGTEKRIEDLSQEEKILLIKERLNKKAWKLHKKVKNNELVLPEEVVTNEEN